MPPHGELRIGYKASAEQFGPRDLVELGSLTPPAAAFLEASVRAGLNILSPEVPRRARRLCSTA